MSLGNLFLAKRWVRAFLFLLALTVAVGLAIWGENLAVRVLGVLAGALIVLLLKVLAEVLAATGRLENNLHSESSRLARSLAQSEGAIGRLSADLERLGREVAGLETATKRTGDLLERQQLELSGTGKRVSAVEEETAIRFESLASDNREAMGRLSTVLDEFIASLRPSRRHPFSSDTTLRELGLRETLDGLATSEDSPGRT